MINDKILIGALIGFLADVLKLMVNYLLFSLGFTKVVFWQIVATLFLQKDYLFNTSAYFIGGVADIIFTALLGVIFVHVVYLWGPKYLWIKGAAFGLVVWVSVFGVLISRIAEEKLPQDPNGVVVTIIAHIVFGLSLAFFTRVFKQDRVIPLLKYK